MMRLAVCLLAPRPAPQSRWGLSDFALPLPTHSLLANSQASLPHQLLLTPALQEKADQVEKGDEKFLWGGWGGRVIVQALEFKQPSDLSLPTATRVLQPCSTPSSTRFLQSSRLYMRERLRSASGGVEGHQDLRDQA